MPRFNRFYPARGVYAFASHDADTSKHVKRLQAGIAKLQVDGFLGEVCGVCKGHGEYRQHYIEGRMTGVCSYCEGTGATLGDKAVTDSVLNQILVAADTVETIGKRLAGRGRDT